MYRQSMLFGGVQCVYGVSALGIEYVWPLVAVFVELKLERKPVTTFRYKKKTMNKRKKKTARKGDTLTHQPTASTNIKTNTATYKCMCFYILACTTTAAAANKLYTNRRKTNISVLFCLTSFDRSFVSTFLSLFRPLAILSVFPFLLLAFVLAGFRSFSAQLSELEISIRKAN